MYSQTSSGHSLTLKNFFWQLMLCLMRNLISLLYIKISNLCRNNIKANMPDGPKIENGSCPKCDFNGSTMFFCVQKSNSCLLVLAYPPKLLVTDFSKSPYLSFQRPFLYRSLVSIIFWLSLNISVNLVILLLSFD